MKLKKTVIGAVATLTAVGALSAACGDSSSPTVELAPGATTSVSAAAKPGSAAPAEGEAALAKANTYASDMNMSKAAVREQLSSQYGEKFPADAVEYAMALVKADWKANAVVKARSYRDDMNMSKQAILEQLSSPYGEKFTKDEAAYAVANMDKK